MRQDRLYRKITADEFLAMDFGTDRKFELVDGVIYMMTGATEKHAWVQGNLYFRIRSALEGSKCRAYGSEMGIRVTDTDVRYPDVSVFCGSRPDEADNVLALSDPKVVIEVISSSTAMIDQGTKLEEYKALSSIEVVGFVDPMNELIRTVRRTSAFGWLDANFAVRDLELPGLGIVISHADIFAPV